MERLTLELGIFVADLELRESEHVGVEACVGEMIVVAGQGEEYGAVFLLQDVEEIFDSPGDEVEEVGVDELHHIISLQGGEDGENIVEVSDGAEESRFAVEQDVAVGVHVSSAVGDNGYVVASLPEFPGEAGVEVGVVA